MQDFQQAYSYIAALTGQAVETVVVDLRALHDTEKGAQGINMRGTLAELWPQILHYQSQGYGIFSTLNPMDGDGRKYDNVAYIRAHAIDLDNVSATQNYQRAAAWTPAPSFVVFSSPNKYHIYWSVQPYTGNDYAKLIQRKLRQYFDGDKSVIDPTRVLRLPGTLHLKNPEAPYLVTCAGLAGFGQWLPVQSLDTALASVNIVEAVGNRYPLGEEKLSAPSLDWLRYALTLVDPNDLDRLEWLAITSAVKQAGWLHADPQSLRQMWDDWCARYAPDAVGADGKRLVNDQAENDKLWESINDTETGWRTLVNRVPGLRGMTMFGGKDRTGEIPPPPATVPPAAPDGAPSPMPTPGTAARPDAPQFGDMLNHLEQKQYFNGCIYVTKFGEILTSENRFLGSGTFNAVYGGKKFIIDNNGKVTDEAWKAATRGTLYKVPIVDHTRFTPDAAYRAELVDDMGRIGLNMYKPANVRRVPGDPSPFLAWLAAILPSPVDQRILLDYLAHNAKYPGYKIPWAFVIQSAEGIGKGILKALLMHVMGRSYTHFPNSKELQDSGAKFNSWMRNKLFILADEIRVDDRRDMIEVLKPMISERIIEVQGKGENQDMEDNVANWGFFTNWKDAIPTNKNSRRFAIFYSPLQTAEDIFKAGLNEQYFKHMFAWLEADGAAIVANWLMDYPIERGAIPMRAPETSTSGEAVKLSRGPVERVLMEAIEDETPGFRQGWIATRAVAKVMKANSIRPVSPQTLETILTGMGYVLVGRAPRAFMMDDPDAKSYLFHMTGAGVTVDDYGPAQGY